MTIRSGSADLPLHHGRVPAWLGQRMTRLGAVISQAIVHHYGRDEFLRRLADPFWFQSFGAVMGMDWHPVRGERSVQLGRLRRSRLPALARRKERPHPCTRDSLPSLSCLERQTRKGSSCGSDPQVWTPGPGNTL